MSMQVVHHVLLPFDKEKKAKGKEGRSSYNI